MLQLYYIYRKPVAKLYFSWYTLYCKYNKGGGTASKIARAQARSIALCIAKDIHQYALDHAEEYEAFLKELGDKTNTTHVSTDRVDHAASPYSA